MLNKKLIKNAGFTLIELLVVIGVLGTLASALVATIDPFEQLKKTSDASIKNTAIEFADANIRFYATHNAMLWVDDTNCLSEIGTGTTLDKAPSCLDSLINNGELKQSFNSVKNTLNKIYISTCNNNPIICFNPNSASQNHDVNTKYNQNGAIRQGCPATNGISKDCYWCSEPSTCTTDTGYVPSGSSGSSGSVVQSIVSFFFPSPTPIASSSATPTPTPTPTPQLLSHPPLTGDSVFYQATDGSWCYDSDGNQPKLYSISVNVGYSSQGFCQDNTTGIHDSYCKGYVARNWYCSGNYNGTTWSKFHCSDGGYTCNSPYNGASWTANSCLRGSCYDTATLGPTQAKTIPSQFTIKGGDGTWCYDTNGNGGLQTKGTCQDNKGLYTNYCAGDNIHDYYCTASWDGYSYSNVRCEAGIHGCHSQYFLTCYDGACLYPNLIPAPTPIASASGH